MAYLLTIKSQFAQTRFLTAQNKKELQSNLKTLDEASENSIDYIINQLGDSSSYIFDSYKGMSNVRVTLSVYKKRTELEKLLSNSHTFYSF